MVGMLPPSPLEALWLALAVLSLVLFVWAIARRRRRACWVTILQLTVATLLVVPFLAYALFPPINRAHREYYLGKDQFEWTAQLWATNPTARQHAVSVLCQMIRSSKTGSVRYSIVQGLGERGPEAKNALPVLKELLNDRDDLLRDVAREAIRYIERENLPNDKTK
jgi:hypothetical protein